MFSDDAQQSLLWLLSGDGFCLRVFFLFAAVFCVWVLSVFSVLAVLSVLSVLAVLSEFALLAWVSGAGACSLVLIGF